MHIHLRRADKAVGSHFNVVPQSRMFGTFFHLTYVASWRGTCANYAQAGANSVLFQNSKCRINVILPHF
jgi:hypothetical protein